MIIAPWRNGSTTGFGPVRLGSNPGTAIKITNF